MDRRAKNYLSYVAVILLTYFLGLTILSASEEHTLIQRLNPESAPQIGIGYYLLIALLGALLLCAIAWIYLSRKNAKTFKEVMQTKKGQTVFACSGISGALLSCLASLGLIGSLPAMPHHADLTPSVAINDSTEASEQEVSTTSVYIPPIPELPPIKPAENHIELAKGIQTIADQQTITDLIESNQPDLSCVLGLDGSHITIDSSILQKSGDSTVLEDALLFGVNGALVAAPGSTLNVLATRIETNGLANTGVVVNGLNATASLTGSDVLTNALHSPAYFAGYQGQLKVTEGYSSTQADASAIFVPQSTTIIEAQSLNANTLGLDSPLVLAQGILNGSNINATIDRSVLAKIKSGGDVTLSDSKFTVGAMQAETDEHAIFVLENRDQSEKQDWTVLNLNNNEWIVPTTSPASNDAFCFVIDHVGAQIELINNTIYQVPQLAKVSAGKLNLNCIQQTLQGPLVADQDSEVDMNLTQSSIFTGSINANQACPKVKLSLDESSQIVLTDNIYVSEFNNANAANTNITTNGFHIFVNGNPVV